MGSHRMTVSTPNFTFFDLSEQALPARAKLPSDGELFLAPNMVELQSNGTICVSAIEASSPHFVVSGPRTFTGIPIMSKSRPGRIGPSTPVPHVRLPEQNDNRHNDNP